MNDDRLLRMFIAVPLTDDFRRTIVGWQKQLAGLGADIRWVEPNALHVTLQFLGDRQASEVDLVTQAVRQGVGNKIGFTVDCARFGVFPRWDKPRVLWIGIEKGAPELRSLATDIGKALADLGISFDQRAFVPHITVGRFRGEASASRIKAAVDDITYIGSFSANSVSVMKSVLTPQRPIYTRLATIELR